MKRLLVVAVALCLTRWCAAEDWTTTNGKTYHDVHELGHNDIEVNISCLEGKSLWVLLKDMPPDLQKKHRYDPVAEAKTNAIIPHIGVAIPGTPPDPAEYAAYAARIRQLTADPTVLTSLPSGYMTGLVRSRLNLGSYFIDRFTPEDAASVRRDETILVGLMLMSLEFRVDPNVDTSQPVSIQDQSPAAQAIKDAMQAKRTIWDYLQGATRLLNGLWRKRGDRSTSVDPQVRPILTAAGVDSASIDLLVGKTKAPDH